MIKIAISDDQSLFRNMLAYLLKQESEFEVVGEAGDGNGAIALCETMKPDIMLLDIKMPGTGGLSALSTIKEFYPHVKVIMLTTFEDDSNIFQALCHLADGYIVKDTKPEVLVHIIKCVYWDLFVTHASVRQYISRQLLKVADLYPNEDAGDTMDFDTIDLTIMRLISIGKNNAQIAAQISYSEGTVKNRISKMLTVTGSKDRTQLAIFALQNGIV